MVKTAIILVLLCFPARSPSAAGDYGYCVALMNTPVLNTPGFGRVFGGTDGKMLGLDSSGHIRELEFIALPGTVFRIISRKADGRILEVRTRDYPYYDEGLFIDSRFVSLRKEKPGDRKRALPARDEFLRRLVSMEGTCYLWGGNTEEGVALMSRFYEPSGDVSGEVRRKWELKGVDCSGLLYLASGGFTPRNTSSLVRFGRGVEISGLSAAQIADILRPLDIIVWVGHVVIVLDDERVIESTAAGGVHTSPLSRRLESIINTRVPSDDWDSEQGRRFVVRRFFPAGD